MVKGDKQILILNAALQLFVEQGFHATPTSQIAKEASVANGTLFHHFKTKDELILALYIDIKIKLNGFIESNAAGNDKNLREKLHMYYQHSLYWALENPVEFRYIQQFMSSPFATLVDQEKVHEQTGKLNALIREGINNGIIKSIPMELVFTMLSSHVFGINQYLLSGGFSKEKQKEIIEHSFELVWDMISL
jgi:AcrR family transcriptional regulator